MDRQRIDKKAETVDIRAKSNKEFFLIHGYTGSPTDFNQLGLYLNKKFNANVKIIRLKGHGEKIENIDNLNYSDFLLQAESELKKDLKKGRKIIIGGISIGSFISLQLSIKYPLKGVLCVSLPYKYKFPIGLIAVIEPLIPKKHWKKKFSIHEKELRKNAFFYDVHARGLRIVNQGRDDVNEVLDQVNVPCLMIHSIKEKVFHPAGMELVKNKINSRIIEIKTFVGSKRASHNPFYAQNHKELYEIIGKFVERNKIFD